ncbi:hypothetical protein RR46_10212 [Papilio xuthus]|uniref:SIAH-type domain-containing protein n=1 Tax=Papilio xuthus TaxID=66420 RepID=A0A194Q1M4_PAPXU|nr:hypothetical protein RR46_10212 [Papilio xuthus]
MGNEQSSENERRKRDANIQATLQKTLEKQRQIYEQRCKEMLQTQAEALRKEQLASTSVNITAGTSRDCQNNLYPNLQPSTSSEHSSPIVYTSPLSYQRYSVTSQNNDLTTNTATVSSANDAQRVIPSAPPMTYKQPMKVNSVQNYSGLGTEHNCPKCGNKFGLHIFQCGSGHSSCRNCKINSGICGVLNCGKKITDMRNRTLEAYMADLMLTTKQGIVKDCKPVNQQTGQYNSRLNCPNHHDGCCLHFTTNEMDNHLKECPYNEMACPLLAIFGRCSWRGKFNQLDGHFADCHPEHRRGQVDTEMSIVGLAFKKMQREGIEPCLEPQKRLKKS